jgi:hypothetical protein
MKLNRYLDFILESVSKGKMRLYYSNEFRNMLRVISSKSSIALALLSAEDSNQMTDIYTLIDITDKNDKISLIQVNRITRDNPDLDDTLPYNIRSKESGSDFWNKSRTEIFIGRWVRRIFTDVYKTAAVDSKIEEFVNLYKSTFDGEGSLLELVEGEDIRKWYLYENYESNKGQLGASCMRHKQCQSYLDIYVKNPEVCKLLILKSKDNPDKISGRALIWKLNVPEKYKNLSGLYPGEYYMDRIYTNTDSDKILFENWTSKNKMKSYSNPPTGFKSEMYIQLGDYDYEYYPYMDTFLTYSRYQKILSNNEDLWPTAGFIKMQETSGGYSSDDVVWSDYGGEYIPNDDAVFCEDIQDHLYRDNAIYLDYKDMWVSDRNVVWSEYHGEYFISDDAVRSECMDDYLYKENEGIIELIINSKGHTDWCHLSRTDLYVKIKDQYYLGVSVFFNPYTNEYEFTDGKKSKEVFEKIIDEVLPGSEIKYERSFSNIERDEIIKQTVDIFNETDLRDVIEEIKRNPVFSELTNVYWGLPKDQKVEAEDLPILLLFSNFIDKSRMFEVNSLKDKWVWIKDPEVKKKLETKFKYWSGDYRIFTKIVKLSNSFDFTKFGEDIYKRVLLFTL